MPSATTSGADRANGGTAKSRDHNQGNQDRSYTTEQKAAVIRVRRCTPTAFYDILGLESVRTSCTESEIKKAYRKLSLLTHPDKNGHEHADEAFKMVSRAFGILGDPDKKKQYDRFGGDPDSRTGGGAPPQNPFSRGTPSASRSAGGGGSMWEEEISPEEMFNRFFGGGGFGGGGMFNAGPQFVFNMGGGPNVRVHQFGGGRPQRRPRDPNAPPAPPASPLSTLLGLLPLLILFIIPLLQSIFSGAGEAAGPSMRFDSPIPPHTELRTTQKNNVKYYVNPAEIVGLAPHKLRELDYTAEVKYVQNLKIGCERERTARQRLVDEAQGWFLQDTAKMQQAHAMKMPNCATLNALGLPQY